jgi:hypothetical protein
MELQDQSWCIAASDLLDRTGTPISAVAEKLGHHRGVTRRHLNGEMRPDKEMTYRTNAAIASLLGSDWVRDYLDAVALESGFIVDETRDDDAFGGFIACLTRVSHYIAVGDFEKIIPFVTSTLSKARQKKLFASATRLLYRWLTLEIDGEVPKTTFFEEFKKLCLKYDVPLARWPRDKRELQYSQASDEFGLEVMRALLDATDDEGKPVLTIRQRNTALGRISAASWSVENALAHWKID